MRNCCSSIKVDNNPCLCVTLWFSMVLLVTGPCGNCFLMTWTVLFLLTANWVVTGFIGVHVDSIPCTYNCLLSCQVFSPTSAWSNWTHIIPDGLCVWCICMNAITFPAPFVIPSSLLVFSDISVLFPLASFSIVCYCVVFLESLCTLFQDFISELLWLGSYDTAIMLWYHTWYLIWHGMLNHWTHWPWHSV